jgi:hypothetical protein
MKTKEQIYKESIPAIQSQMEEIKQKLSVLYRYKEFGLGFNNVVLFDLINQFDFYLDYCVQNNKKGVWFLNRLIPKNEAFGYRYLVKRCEKLLFDERSIPVTTKSNIDRVIQNLIDEKKILKEVYFDLISKAYPNRRKDKMNSVTIMAGSPPRVIRKIKFNRFGNPVVNPNTKNERKES